MSEPILFSLIAGAFVGFSAGYLGSIMVSERMALVGDALSHVALPGLAVGILFSFDPFIGAFGFLLAAVVVTWYLQRSTTLPVESIVGVMFVLALAVGILVTPQPELLEALFGDITKVSLSDAVVTAIASVLVVLITKRIYNKIVLNLISRELAVSSGINVDMVNLVYLFLVALVVALGIKMVGTLLVGALVIVPAAAAVNTTSTLLRYSLLSGTFGLISAVLGILLSNYAGVPAGPLVVLVGTAIFAGGIALKKVAQEKGPKGSVKSLVRTSQSANG